jgi:hypothetical protein
LSSSTRLMPRSTASNAEQGAVVGASRWVTHSATAKAPNSHVATAATGPSRLSNDDMDVGLARSRRSQRERGPMDVRARASRHLAAWRRNSNGARTLFKVETWKRVLSDTILTGTVPVIDLDGAHIRHLPSSHRLLVRRKIPTTVAFDFVLPEIEPT